MRPFCYTERVMQPFLWIILASLSAIFAALVAIFGKIGLSNVDTTLATMVRSAFMFLVLLLAVVFMGKVGGLRAIPNKTLLYIALTGLAGAFSWLCYFWALKIGKASQVATIDRLSLVLVIIMAAIFLGEKIGWKVGMGAALMTAGAVLITLAK